MRNRPAVSIRELPELTISCDPSRWPRLALILAVALSLSAALSLAACTSDPAPATTASIGPKPTTGLVSNQRIAYSDGLHNENTDLARWNNRTWLVFRGGETSQVGSPKARLNVYASVDLGDTWTPTAQIFMPDRDIRDPKLVVDGAKLVIYAISRVPGGHLRDAGGLAWTVRSESSDGTNWSPPVRIYDETWGFWRFARHGGKLWATAYNDGDLQVALLNSVDGKTWQKVSLIYDSQPDVPSEAELQFLGDTAVALVRLDNGVTLLDEGHMAICVAKPPYMQWNCDRKLNKRLDGPNWFQYGGKQFVVGRKHLPGVHKRTAVYQLQGDLVDLAADVTLVELAELKSAGDTSYVGVLPLGGAQFLLAWYSSDVAKDQLWGAAMFAPSDIWLGWLDLSKLAP